MSPKVRKKKTNARAGNTGQYAGEPPVKKVLPSFLRFSSGRPLSYAAVLKGWTKLDDDEAYPNDKDNTPKPIDAEKMKPSTSVVTVLKPPGTAFSKAKGGRIGSKNKSFVPSQPKTALQVEKCPNRDKGDGKDNEPVALAPDSMQPVSSLAKNTVKAVKKARKRGKRGEKKTKKKSVTSTLSATKGPTILGQGRAAVADAETPELPTVTKNQQLLKSSSLIHKSDSVKPSDESPAFQADACSITEKTNLSSVKEDPSPVKEDPSPGEQHVPDEPASADSRTETYGQQDELYPALQSRQRAMAPPWVDRPSTPRPTCNGFPPDRPTRCLSMGGRSRSATWERKATAILGRPFRSTIWAYPAP